MATASRIRMLDDRFHYGEDEHRHYLRHGYCFFDHFLTEEGLGEGRRQIERMLRQLHQDISPEWIVATHRLEPWVFALATEPKILDMIERQIGPNITFWSSHLLCKPPRTGRDVPWHQDAREWKMSGNYGASVWIPFDDVDAASGTMSIIPGWHRKGALRQIPRGDKRDDFYADIDPEEFPEDLARIAVTYNLKAGQAAIHHVMTPHNSTPNKSDHWRRVLIFRYLAADADFVPGTYYDYRTNEAFERIFYLVRGDDVNARGLPRSPFENDYKG